MRVTIGILAVIFFAADSVRVSIDPMPLPYCFTAGSNCCMPRYASSPIRSFAMDQIRSSGSFWASGLSGCRRVYSAISVSTIT